MLKSPQSQGEHSDKSSLSRRWVDNLPRTSDCWDRSYNVRVRFQGEKERHLIANKEYSSRYDHSKYATGLLRLRVVIQIFQVRILVSGVGAYTNVERHYWKEAKTGPVINKKKFRRFEESAERWVLNSFRRYLKKKGVKCWLFERMSVIQLV